MCFDPRRSHLTSWGDVREHLADHGRWQRYRELLNDFGIDPDLVIQGEQQSPRFLYAEHPGNWAYPADVARVRLATALASRFDREADVLQFDNDVFRKNGIKRFFTQWCLHPLLPWVSLARAKPPGPKRYQNGRAPGPSTINGRSTHQRVGPRNAWHRQVYGSIQLQGLNRQSLSAKLDTALQLIRCVADGEVPLALLNSELPKASRELLGGPWNRRSAHRLATAMADSDLMAAQPPLEEGLRLLEEPQAITWADLWQQVNSVLLGLPVGRIDPILERFVLAIRDPYRMAQRLADLDDADRVPVAAFVEEGEFRLVLYEASTRRFLAMRSTGDRWGQEIAWDTVRRHARDGQGATPSATIEYLMLAAGGFLVVSDPHDGQTPFERRVEDLHREAIGRRFPWVSLTSHFVKDHSGSYLDCYHAKLGTFIQQKIDVEFFREGPR